MTENQRPKPIAEGHFSKTPFAHILVYLHNRKLSGTLEVRSTAEVLSIYFREGVPAKVRSSIKGKGLGRILHDLGLIGEDELRAAQQEMTRTGAFQGEILLRRGAIDTAGLVRGLREQMLLKLIDVFAMDDGRYEFYEKLNLLVGYGPDELFPLDPLPLLMAGLRVHHSKMKLDPVLDTVKDKWICIPDVEPLGRMRLEKDERELCRELLGDPVSFDILAGSGKYNLGTLRAVVYALLITKLLRVVKAPVADRPQAAAPRRSLDSFVPPPRAPAAAAIHDPAVLAQRERIQSKATAISSQNYFEMLGIPAGSDVVTVQEAFARLAREFHPDRAARPEMADLAETLDYVFSNLSEARATLIDPDSRSAYERAVAEGAGRTSYLPGARDTRGTDEVRDVLEAEKLFQKALMLQKRQDYDKALGLIDRARELNPNQGEYLAVWANLQTFLRPGDGQLEDLIATLRRAEEMAPRSERVHLHLAQLLKRIGHQSESRTHFERVLEVNPRNIEASRELRLMEMRRGREQEKRGFFRKILG
jgi:tetratricopeptide (TPR) repeat protein